MKQAFDECCKEIKGITDEYLDHLCESKPWVVLPFYFYSVGAVGAESRRDYLQEAYRLGKQFEEPAPVLQV